MEHGFIMIHPWKGGFTQRHLNDDDSVRLSNNQGQRPLSPESDHSPIVTQGGIRNEDEVNPRGFNHCQFAGGTGLGRDDPGRNQEDGR